MATTTVLTEPLALKDALPLSQLPPAKNDTPQILHEEPETPRLDRDVYLKIAAAAIAFFVAGTNDGSTGSLMPYFIREYHVSTAVVSVLYASNFIGWLFAAVTNAHLMQHFDLGGLLVAGTLFQMLAQVLRVWLPPFPLFVISFCVVCMGQGYQDTGGNTYCAGVPRAHIWLAIIHASYTAGGLVAPFVATAVAAADAPSSRWWLFFTFPLGLGAFNTLITAYAYRDTIKLPGLRPGPTRRDATLTTPSATVSDELQTPAKKPSQLMVEALSLKSVWLLSIFYFFYLGAALTSAGWLVEYLVQIRGGDLKYMGYVPAGLNGGTFLGRLLLAEPIHRYGERRMVFIFALLCIAFQLVFWLVPNIIAASIAVSFVGFFCGPFFATGMSVGSKLVPHDLRSTAMAFIFVFAQAGGNMFPLVTGIIASRVGVSVLQPLLIGLWAGAAISWLLVPQVEKANNPSLHDE